MAGEINGTNAVLVNGTGEIVGQGAGTLTWIPTPIEIRNKSNNCNMLVNLFTTQKRNSRKSATMRLLTLWTHTL